MGAHGSIASHRAPGVAILRIRESIILHLIIPRLYQLENRSIPEFV